MGISVCPLSNKELCVKYVVQEKKMKKWYMCTCTHKSAHSPPSACTEIARAHMCENVYIHICCVNAMCGMEPTTI